MTDKQISGSEARKALLDGVKLVSEPVGSTLGPSGKTVVIGKLVPDIGGYVAHVTKDGATVASQVFPKDQVSQLGAQIVKQAALKTAKVAGDGTTTSTVLAAEMIERGLKLVEKGYNPHGLKKGMEKAKERVLQELFNCAIPVDSVESLYNIAKISANGDEDIAKNVSEAYGEPTLKSTVSIAFSKDSRTHVEKVDGMRVNAHTQQAFFNNFKNMRYQAENAVVVVTTEEVSTFAELKNVGDYCAQNNLPLIVVANAVIGEAYGFLQSNAQKFRICVVTVGDYGSKRNDVLRDIAIVTGARPLGKEHSKGVGKSKPEDWGRVKTAEIYSDRMVITSNEEVRQSEAYLNHVHSLEQAKSQENVGEDEKNWIIERLSNVQGNISVIHVGANTDVETKELYDRYEDAVLAVRSAIKGGYLAGGGSTLSKIGRYLRSGILSDSEEAGFNLVCESLLAPLERIYQNKVQSEKVVESKRKVVRDFTKWFKKWFGVEKERRFAYSEVVEKVSSSRHGYGWNAKTGDYVDMITAGIIDPAIVPQAAVENAVSAAGSIITSSHVIVNI